MLRNILTAALALFVAMACETYSPNPARRTPGEEVTVNVNVPSAPAPNSDATTDAVAPVTDSGSESPEADAAIEESDSHHPNPGQGGDADATVTEADAEVVNVEPDAVAETPDAAEPHQAPDSDVVDQAPDAAPVSPEPQARRICVEVHPECVLMATSDDETNDNGDPLEGIRFQDSRTFCFSVVEGENVTALVNAITPVPDANGDFIYALSVTARNQDGNWCDNGLPGRQSNMRVDETCFVGETPSQLGFVQHCTARDGDGWTMNWRWSNQH